MARRRSAKRGGQGTRTPRAATPRGDTAETGLLVLARELAAIARDDAQACALAQALDHLAHAFRPDAALPAALAAATARVRGDKARLLALAWAREQVRLSLGEILERAGGVKRARAELPVEALAWLLLAGFEALAHEPPEARPDRIRTLLALLGPPDAGAPAG